MLYENNLKKKKIEFGIIPMKGIPKSINGLFAEEM